MVVGRIIICRFGVLLLIILASSCKEKSIDYSHLLNLTTRNKIQIQKAVKYLNEETNADKIVFAKYLIESLRSQYRVNYFIKNGKNSLLLNQAIDPDSLQKLICFPGNHLIIDTIRSIDEFEFNFILKQVDLAYSNRKKYKWFRDIPIKKYCELILPYRINNELNYDYKEVFGNRYLPFIEEVLMKNTDTTGVLGNYLAPFFEHELFAGLNHVDFTSQLRISDLIDGNSNYKDIEDVASLHTHGLRAIGIPAAYEFTPYILPFNHGDIIVSVIDDNDNSYFSIRSREIYRFRVAKFYRNVFDVSIARNPYKDILEIGVDTVDVPFCLNIPKCIDITDKKTEVRNVNVIIPEKYRDEKVLYLATGSENRWVIISWAKVKANITHINFSKIGVGMQYHLCSYHNGKMTMIGDPFFLNRSL